MASKKIDEDLFQLVRFFEQIKEETQWNKILSRVVNETICYQCQHPEWGFAICKCTPYIHAPVRVFGRWKTH